MAKRWIIRSLFMVPVVLCLMGWGWSGWYLGGIAYSRGHRWLGVTTMDGAVDVVGGWDLSVRDGYEVSAESTGSVRFWPVPSVRGVSLLGFRWEHFKRGDSHGTFHELYALVIPYWFPLLSASLFLFVVWRKTRLRPDPMTAFPVVMREGSEVKRIQS